MKLAVLATLTQIIITVVMTSMFFFLGQIMIALILVSISMYISGSVPWLQTSEFAPNTYNLSLFRLENTCVCLFV